MSAAQKDHSVVLTAHPTTRGFGWVIFEGPASPVDWGIAFARGKGRERLLRRFERLLTKYEPSVLVLERFDARVGASLAFCKRAQHMAACRNIEIPVFSRAAIQAVFASAGARTRHEIAEVICSEITAFSHWRPRKRSLLVREDPKQSLFDAAALAITYFAVARAP